MYMYISTHMCMCIQCPEYISEYSYLPLAACQIFSRIYYRRVPIYNIYIYYIYIYIYVYVYK